MSPKTGRPKADNPKSIRYSIRLDLETEQKLQAYCGEYGMTKGEAIRRGIYLLLSEKNNRNAPTKAKFLLLCQPTKD